MNSNGILVYLCNLYGPLCLANSQDGPFPVVVKVKTKFSDKSSVYVQEYE